MVLYDAQEQEPGDDLSKVIGSSIECQTLVN